MAAVAGIAAADPHPLLRLIERAPCRADLDAIIADDAFVGEALRLTDGGRAVVRAAVIRRRAQLGATHHEAPKLPPPPGNSLPSGSGSPRAARSSGGLRFAWRPCAWWQGGALVIDGPTPADSASRATTARTASPRAILDALPPHVRRVYICGDRPGGSSPAMRAWFTGWLAADPGGWAAVPPTWRDDDRSPMLRVARRNLHGELVTVELRRAAEWFGDDADQEQCAVAMRALTQALREGFGDPHAIPVGSPATTGLQLWRRTHPTERFAPLPPELRDLVRTTAGQGRQELCPAPGLRRAPLYVLDGRLAYAALCWGLPDASGVTDDELPEYAGHRRGRYLVDFSVPSGWAHVGLLGIREEDRWVYPAAPGASGTTWCDGAELQLALDQGWPCTIRRRLLFAEDRDARRPLDRWASKLIDIRAGISKRVERGQLPADIGELVEAALRAILLHGIGRFASGGRVVTRYVSGGELPADIRRDTIVAEERDGEGWRITVREQREDAWSQMVEHPEWAASVWARQRRRLLDGPQQTGVLHLPRKSVLAMYVDALYLTENPHWADDGKPGRFRLKGELTAKIAVPRTWPDLHAAARRAKL